MVSVNFFHQFIFISSKMQPNFSQSFFLFPLILFLLSHHFPRSLCLDDYRYTDCNSSSGFQCGAELGKIEYPFWVSGRQPEYCGHPAFKLDCEEGEGEYAVIEIVSQRYKVLQIDYGSQILKIVTVKNAFPTKPLVCPESTVLDSILFESNSSVRMVAFTLTYNCSADDHHPEYSYNFSCKIGDQDHEAYLTTNTSWLYELKNRCEYGEVIGDFPVLERELQGLKGSSDDQVGKVLRAGFEVRWRADNGLCQKCILSGGTCGYDISSNKSCCFCRDKPYQTTCSKSSNISKKIILAIAAGGVGILFAIILIIFSFKRRAYEHRLMLRSHANQNIGEFVRNYGSQAPKRYSYSDIKKMTNSFKDKLGQGGYGSVYEGKLGDGRLVAVKLINTSKGNGEEFINEVASISRTSHVNIVSLLGFCFERGKKALIYEFMRNGSLENFLCSETPLKASKHLGWEKLYQIAVGIARGLEYLHCGCRTKILHFDVKPHNILLDQDFTPKISDFGLAKLCPSKESIVSMSAARGTIGYVAPEVFSRNFGRVSHKSDVYSYGMMILEMVGGRQKCNGIVDNTSEIYFPHWIYKHLEQQEADLGVLKGVENKEENEVTRKMIVVGLWCIQTDPSHRPCMSKVIEMLEGSVEGLQLPPKPFLSSPPRFPLESSSFKSTLS